FEFSAVSEYGVEFCQRRGAPDPTERNNRLRAYCRSVHRADRLQSIRCRERFPRQCARRDKIEVELFWFRRFPAFRSVNRGRARILILRQADPKIEMQWPGKNFVPIIR